MKRRHNRSSLSDWPMNYESLATEPKPIILRRPRLYVLAVYKRLKTNVNRNHRYGRTTKRTT